ncbi:MAG: sialidase family protein [Bacillota bacterium]
MSRLWKGCLVWAAVLCLVHSTHADSVRIDWDQKTLTLIEPAAVYGRMIRLASKEILCTYEKKGGVWTRKSRDDGRTWDRPIRVDDYLFGAAANPEILQLRNGWVLLSYNERPKDGKHPFAIKVCVSRDGGETWSASAQVYAADTRWENGCWEPAQIQLPSGQIQLFFANENLYRASQEQEITMVRSDDNGASWSSPQTVSFRKGHRDGMPVPLILQGGKGIVVAIEDDGLNGAFKPAIVFSSLSENWAGGCVDGKSPRRWSALMTPLPSDVYAGAPYLRQLAGGQTVLSVQSREGRQCEQMVVYIGDENARNFSGKSVPFDIPDNVPGRWNSLFIKDEATITAISSTTMKGTRGLWAIDGHVVRRQEPAEESHR